MNAPLPVHSLARLFRRCGLSLCLTLLLCLFAGAPARAAVIDIMIVFDSRAAAWVDQNGGREVFADEAVTRMNLAAQNSGIDLTFNLVYAAVVSYVSTANLNTDLSNLTSGSGALAEIQQWRNTYGADMVSLLVDNGPFTGSYVAGIGWLLNSMAGAPDYPFTVCEVRSVALEHTLTHEVGHNLGAHHSKDQLSAPGPNGDLNSYSAGWYFTGESGANYHTIMAYGFDGYGNYYTEVPFFSTPLKYFDQVPVGDAADGDNARTIAATMDVVAGYRAGTSCDMPPSLTVPQTDADGSFSVSWAQSATTGVVYVLEEATDNSFATGRVAVYSGPETSIALSGRVAGQTYYYRVRATKAGLLDSAWRTGGNGCAIDPLPIPALGEAVDNLVLTWSSGGAAMWQPQSAVAFSGGDAAASGSISDGQITFLQTTVAGPGTLAYYWKVSSETDYDYLEFYVDGVRRLAISGEVPWRQETVALGEGVHALRWEYVKDDSVADGSDRGWVDAVVWTPAVACATPASLTVPTVDADGNSYLVSWGASATPGVSYVLEEATNSAFTDAQVIFNGGGSSMPLTGRSLYNTYYYRVKATRSGYADSAWRTAGNGCAVPGWLAAKPVSLAVPVADWNGDGAYNVTWGASATPGVTYVLEESTSPAFYQAAGLRVAYIGTERKASITGRELDKTYYYRAKAIRSGYRDSVYQTNAAGCAIPGATVVATPPTLTVPNSDGDGAYTVTWGASATSGVTYVLEEATSPNFMVGLRLAYSGTMLSRSFTGRPQNVTYYYRVKAVKAGAKDSAWRMAYKGCALPGSATVDVPVTVSVPASDPDGKYVVSWEAALEPGVKYFLQEATDATFTLGLRTAYFGVNTFANIGGRTAGKSYYYRVQAVKPGLVDSNRKAAANGCAVGL